MGHLSMHGDFHLKATVVRRDHLVAEAGGNHQIGVDDIVLEQPGGADFTAKFFIVGEQQFDTALTGFCHRLQSAQRKREGRKITFTHGTGAAIYFPVLDLAAIGIFGPAFPWRHHIAVGVQQHGFAGPVVASNQQVGDALQTCGMHFGLGHSKLFSVQTKGLQKFCGALCVGRIIARGRVGWHADEFL